MKSSLKILLIVLLVGIGIATIAYFAQTPSDTSITFNFSLTEKTGDGDAPVSEIILNGTGDEILFPEEITVGSGMGCSITKQEDFEFESSIDEVYCYFAGGGQLFQAKETESGDLEVVRYLVTEVPNYENKTYSIEITDPSSVYTFDLLETQHIVK